MKHGLLTPQSWHQMRSEKLKQLYKNENNNCLLNQFVEVKIPVESESKSFL